MMYCSYHAKNPAVVQCNQCARGLCPACDHRVRGFRFCQDTDPAHTDCTEPPRDFWHGSYSTSSRFPSPALAPIVLWFTTGCFFVLFGVLFLLERWWRCWFAIDVVVLQARRNDLRSGARLFSERQPGIVNAPDRTVSRNRVR